MTGLRTVEARGRYDGEAPARVWYASYGSNMRRDRLACYLEGGRPAGGALTYRGCRDPRPPEASVALELRGALYFATESAAWTGGRAFYDPDAPGRVLARAHLITAGQFSDVAAQEMYREPGRDLDLTEVLSLGRSSVGNGRYETLVSPGALDGVPVLTFTAPWGLRDIAANSPSAAYLTHLATGLLEAGAGDALAVARYLAGCSGTAGQWTAEDIVALM